LGGSDPKVADGLGDLELNALLLAWRRDIDSEPLAELVDTDTAVTTVKSAALAQRHRQRGYKRRLLIPVAAAAAVLAIAFTGTGLAARGAQPGDTLWGLSKVLYADHARSIESAAAARIDLQKANVALAGGRIQDAREALNDAQAALTQVAVEDNLNQLMEQHRQLSAQLATPQPTVTTTPAPTSTLPSQTTSQQTRPTPPPSSQLPAGTTTTTPTTSSTTPPVSSTTPSPSSSSTTPSASSNGSSPRYGSVSDSGAISPTPVP
jgi:hypothetical protein